MEGFEKVIREMAAAGLSSTDIANRFVSILNNVQKEEAEKKEKEEAAKREAQKKKEAEEKMKARGSLYSKLKEEFDKAYESGFLKKNDVGTLAAIVFIPYYPDWTEIDIEEFRKGVVETLEMRAKVVGKSPLQGFFSLMDMYDLGDKNSDKKRKSGCEGKHCAAGRTCENNCEYEAKKRRVNADIDAIREFFRNYGF